jgi:hypothetical protein
MTPENCFEKLVATTEATPVIDGEVLNGDTIAANGPGPSTRDHQSTFRGPVGVRIFPPPIAIPVNRMADSQH